MLNYSPELEEYINSHIDPEPQPLRELYRHTCLHHLYPRMCSGHYQGRLLGMLTAMVRPHRVLEVGTFTGYATLSIARAMEPGTHVDTIEIDPEKEDELTERFATCGLPPHITLYTGDALDVIPELGAAGVRWDMVLIDANKRLYTRYLEAVYPFVKAGGFILADNTLWDNKIVDPGSHDAQTCGIRNFNDALAADTRFEKVILPVRDGLTIIRKL